MAIKKPFLACMLMLMTLALVACGKGPAATLEDATYAIEGGDHDAALEIMPPKIRAMFGDAKIKQMLTEGTTDMKNKGGIKDIEIVDEKINGDSAEVTLKITYGNGSSESEPTKMMKVDDKWVLSDEGMNK